MRQMLLPQLTVTALEDLSGELLRSYGLRGLLIDLDNTLIPLNTGVLEESQRRWLTSLLEDDIQVCLVSNAVPKRIQKALAAQNIECPYIAKARKPMTSGFKKGLKALGLLPTECAMLGDQIFTDVFGANRLGIFSIYLKNASPIEQKWMRVVRRLEKWIVAGHPADHAKPLHSAKGDDSLQ